jgi:hypothetical protein
MASAPVGAFFADLTCEPGTSIKVGSVDCSDDNVSNCDMRWNFTVSSNSCDPGANMAFVLGGPLGNAGIQRFGLVARTSCGKSSAADAARLVITTGYLDWEPKLNNTRRFENATALICTPTYSIQQTLLRVGANGSFVSPTPNYSDGGALGTISAAQIADGVWTAVSKTNLTTSHGGTVGQPASLGSTNRPTFNESDSFIGLISLARPDLDLSKATDMETGLRQVFSTTAAQIAQRQLLTPTNANVIGATVQMEKRLHVREVPLRLMEIAFFILIVIRLLIIKTRPAPSTPRDLSSLSGLATVMAQSQAYVFALQGLAASKIQTIGQCISINEYQTVIVEGRVPTFRLDVVDHGDLYERPRLASRASKPSSWWNPLHDLTRLAILAVNFALIITIELLLQRSQKGDGLMNMDFTNSVPYAWAFIPALFSVVLWTFFGIYDFSTRLIQPYYELRKSPVPARRSININYLSRVTVVAIFHAVVNRHFAVLFSALAMLIAPFITILSSSLFQPIAGPQKLSAPVGMVNLANPTNQNAALGAQLPFVASLAIGSNVSWPKWTSDTLVFPALSLSPTIQASGNTTLQFPVPALFASLNCTQVASKDIMLGHENTTFPGISIPVSAGCGAPCLKSTGDCVSVPSSTPQAGAAYGRMFLTKTNSAPKGWNDNCPQISIAYGKTSTDKRSVDDLVVLHCYPAIMQTEANVTFSVGRWALLGPPRVNSANSTRVVNGNSATIDLNKILIGSAFKPLPSGTDFDPAFRALLGGRDPLSLTQLTSSKVPGVSANLNTLYARVFAQHLNLNYRSVTTTQTIVGSMTTLTLRLHQNVIITRVIEALLAAMFFCLCISSLVGDTRHILPNNPCSIAVMSSLIADSEFVKQDIVHEGSEWCNDKELGKRGIFEGYLFSLGMWDKKSPAVFGIDVGQGEKAE